MRFTLVKTISIWFFLFVFSVLYALSAADEIRQGSSVWFVTLNIIIPALIVVSIVNHSLYRKPVRRVWFWKIVPFSYAALCLWDFLVHLPMIGMIGNKFIVIAGLSVQFIAFYLSFKFGFSGKRLEIEPMFPQEKIGAFGKWLIIVTAFLAFFVFLIFPYFVHIDKRDYDSYSKFDIKNAFTAAQVYFTDYPNGSVNLEKLKACGFWTSKDVTLSIGGSTQYNLSMNAWHKNGKKTFQIDWQGNIKEDPPDTDIRLGNFNFSNSRHLYVWKMLLGF
jgi:type IV pilus assembly protein PilA